jgi:hypothetical protein
MQRQYWNESKTKSYKTINSMELKRNQQNSQTIESFNKANVTASKTANHKRFAI